MKNSISDMNNYLFECIERLLDDKMDDDQFERECRRAEKVTEVAETLIHSGELTFKAQKLVQEYGDGKEMVLPALLGGESDVEKKRLHS